MYIPNLIICAHVYDFFYLSDSIFFQMHNFYRRISCFCLGYLLRHYRIFILHGNLNFTSWFQLIIILIYKSNIVRQKSRNFFIIFQYFCQNLFFYFFVLRFSFFIIFQNWHNL